MKKSFLFAAISLFTMSAMTAENRVEKIKFIGEIDYSVEAVLLEALKRHCPAATAQAYDIVAETISVDQYEIDQGQVDTFYNLTVNLVVDSTVPIIGTTVVNQGTGEIGVPVEVRVARYSWNNPSVPNTEVLSLAGTGCSSL